MKNAAAALLALLTSALVLGACADNQDWWGGHHRDHDRDRDRREHHEDHLSGVQRGDQIPPLSSPAIGAAS